MMPNLGQGGGQAMEDVFVLTDLLSGVRDRRDIPAALQEYYKRRILRSAAVQGMSRLSSDVIISRFSTPFSPREFLQQGFGYKYLTWPSLMTWNMRPMLPMLFRAQFSYLYSYAPSAFTPERIADLVRRSLARNEAEVRQVYQHLTNSSVTFFSAKTMSFMAYDRRNSSVRKVADASELRRKAAIVR
jgi:zeaxanthin epoxidase